ncbi:hypothetical protein [Sinomonas sp. R1AF57]|uniref:hypothetical protein n=1 Tax=Sinomonas sp. R1AF57 TaxID=2020377 RepID=UPI000B5F1DD9|nr:hypothetical protein [Sinomonas sp. R1AF57]ASN52497.1 hypothetical protein CGQ25_10770 [Sinomonas sp. R1AF57]
MSARFRPGQLIVVAYGGGNVLMVRGVEELFGSEVYVLVSAGCDDEFRRPVELIDRRFQMVISDDMWPN